MADAFPEIDTLVVGRLRLKTVLSDPYVDVALVGMRGPRFVDLNNEISDAVEENVGILTPQNLLVRAVSQWGGRASDAQPDVLELRGSTA
jgi:hypothetical protein